MSKQLFSISVVTLVLSLWAPSLAQFNTSIKASQPRTGLALDHALFGDVPSGKVRLELYYQFYNFVLQWLPKDDNYTAKYEVVIRVKDKNGRQVDSYTRRRELLVADEKRTRSRMDFRTNQVNFLLEPKEYRVVFSLHDKNSAVTLTRELELKLKDFFSKRPRLSEVEFVRAVTEPKNDSSVFAKNDLIIIPSVTRDYDFTQNNKHLLYYLEIYRGSDQADKVFVEAAVRRKWGSMVYRDSMTIELTSEVSRQLREISLDSLAPGDYELELKLRGRRFKQIDDLTAPFSVAWTQDALLRSDYKRTLQLIEYIADPSEISELSKLKTYEERYNGLTEFWLRRDPTPGSEENEVKNEFFRRVEVANRSFGFMRQPGWRTDRGRVYIKHGEPDELDDYPFSYDSHPYQEWHYYRRGQYRKFTFVDENEDGDYRLVFPYDGLNLRPDF